VVIIGGSSGTQLATARRFVEMSALSASHVSRVLRATPTLAHVFDAVVSWCRRLMTSLFDPYRPELHYMRGPASKSQQKHARGAGR
jgi:NAD(P)-dependent dehydrogenase (short-subunit alcohol dehydrogenase family)